MAITVAQWREHFKNFGKLIQIQRDSATNANEFRLALMALIDQAISGGTEYVTEFDAYQGVFVPFSSNMQTTVTTIVNLGTQVTTSAEKYLTSVLAPDLGLTTSASVAEVGAAMSTAMSGADVWVSGADIAPSGFDVWFSGTMDFSLWNTSGANLIPDSWITLDIIADE